MNSKMRFLSVAAMAALISACSAPGEKKPGGGTDEKIFGEQGEQAAGEQAGAQAETAGTDAEAQALAERGEMAMSPLDDPESVLSNRTIYFDYDSSKVKEEYLDILTAHGEYLAEHPEQAVRIEGHTDERGSREYNIALGDRRAQAVKRLIMFHGVSTDQITTVSYGEERPVAMGHDEAAWSENRRVELIYAGH